MCNTICRLKYYLALSDVSILSYQTRGGFADNTTTRINIDSSKHATSKLLKRYFSTVYQIRYTIKHLYNSVFTCRHIAINSLASAPLNATKIPMMKVSHGRVVMFGPELLFLMYKCWFMACFCARQCAQRLRAELTLAQPKVL